MASRFKSVIALLAAVIVVATAAGAGDLAPEINWADKGNSKMHDKITADTRAFRVGELELAIHDFGDVIRLDPSDVKGYYKRGAAYSGLGQYQRAIQDYDKAIQI